MNNQQTRPPTTTEIEQYIVSENWKNTLTMPHFTPGSWFECDVYTITKSGYGIEYEIKVSRADFLADARKQKWSSLTRAYVTKYDRLTVRDTNGPRKFWYCCPSGVIDVADVPEWAGLLYYSLGRRIGGFTYLNTVKVKNAPKLHCEKVSEQVIRQLHTACYYRFHYSRGHRAHTDFGEGEGI